MVQKIGTLFRIILNLVEFLPTCQKTIQETLKIIEKYFEACKTFQDLPNFRKVILDLLVKQENLKNHREIFWSLQNIPEFVKLQESYFRPSDNPGDFKNHRKIFCSLQNIPGLLKLQKCILDLLAIQGTLKFIESL